MRTLAILVVGMLAVGCKTNAPNPISVSIDELVMCGWYISKNSKDEEGGWISIDYINGEQIFYQGGIRGGQNTPPYYLLTKEGPPKWSIVNMEIHVKHPDGDKYIWRINTDRSITMIAKSIRVFHPSFPEDRKRRDIPKKSQPTFKKIK